MNHNEAISNGIMDLVDSRLCQGPVVKSIRVVRGSFGAGS